MTLRVSGGRLFGLAFEHRREGDVARLIRGVVAINEPPNLPESGLRVQVTAPRFDAEAWAQWLGIDLHAAPASARPASSDEGIRVDYFALRTPELVVERRVFNNVTLGASRTDAGDSMPTSCPTASSATSDGGRVRSAASAAPVWDT